MRRLVGVPKTAGFEEARSDRPFLEEKILKARPGRAMPFGDVVVSMFSRAFGDNEEVEVVLKIAANAGEIMRNRNADRLQMIGWAHPRLHEQLRRAERA